MRQGKPSTGKTTVFLLLITMFAMLSCGKSEEEKQRLSKAERERLAEEYSQAFKIGVMPTLDCLPIYVAKDRGMFDKLKVDVRLLRYNAQMDVDTAMARGRVQGIVTDLVRGERLVAEGTPLRYIAATNAYWQFIGNRKQRIKTPSDLGDKMIAMTRYSATDMLTDLFMDGVKTKGTVFKVQVNDVNIRLDMLLNNEMDALLLTEPQATEARMYKNVVLADSRKSDLMLGVLAFNKRDIAHDRRSLQLQQFIKAYNMACDSINKYGTAQYAEILNKYCNADNKVARAIPKLKFAHATTPRQKDIEAARKWLKK